MTETNPQIPQLEYKASQTAVPDRAGLEELSHEIEQCRLCATQGFVAIPRPLDRGQGLGRVWLIGQAPGNAEAVRKVAFGGPAGRKLMQWFGSIGLEEETVRHLFYLSAISKCYPGRASKGSGDRNPTPTERLNCRPFLLRELVMLRPTTIILVGSSAIQEFYNEKSSLNEIIGQERSLNLGEIYRRLSARLIKRDSHTSIPPLPAYFDSTSPAKIFHLPHPSGASTWLNLPQNRALLEQALFELKEHFAALSPTSNPKFCL